MTGLELFKAPGTTAGEIADIISEHYPPVCPAECDRLACRECWFSWLTTGEPPKAKGPSDKQTAPGEDGMHPNLKGFLHTEGKKYKVTHLGVKLLGAYYSNQELMAHLGEMIYVDNSEKGYEAVTQNGVSLGSLSPRRREGQ